MIGSHGSMTSTEKEHLSSALKDVREVYRRTEEERRIAEAMFRASCATVLALAKVDADEWTIEFDPEPAFVRLPGEPKPEAD